MSLHHVQVERRQRLHMSEGRIADVCDLPLTNVPKRLAAWIPRNSGPEVLQHCMWGEHGPVDYLPR